MKPQLWTLLLALLIAFAATGRVSAAPALTVARLMHEGRPVTSLPDVTLRHLDGTLARRGLKRGQIFPDGVRIQVPARETVVVGHGRSTATLEGGSISTFAYTGFVETVAVGNGKASFEGALDFYHVSGHGVNAAPHGTVYSFRVDSKGVTITCTEGSVETAHVGSTGSGQAVSYVKQVDRISGKGRSSITYALGQESAADVAARVRAYRLAAARGDADAQSDLGAMYQYGEGVPQDYATALHYFQLAAAQGNAFGENNLGVMYLNGQLVAQDYAIARHYFQLAVEQNNAAADSNLGYLYEYGQGVARDYATALRYFRRSAKMGDAKGEANLGVMYANGLDVPRNDVTALRYLQLSAAQGDPFGESNLGWMYDPRRKSQGVAPNYAAALRYYQLSARQIPNAIFYMPTSAQGLTVIKLIPVGHNPQRAVITPDGREVYVSNTDSNTVSVINTRSDTVTNTLQVGAQPGALVVSGDGRYVYVANNGGDVSVIDTGTKKVETISTESAERNNVRDLALTPDGRLFLAMEWSGLQMVDLRTRVVSQVSDVVCPEGLAMTADGKRLYVNYQCGGPGGSMGHDAVAIFDLGTNGACSLSQPLVAECTIQGLPNVGGSLALSPDGSQLWLNGIDACSQPAYDHVGCPMIPGDVVNVIDTSTNKVLKTIVFRPAEGNGSISFLPRGDSVLIGGGVVLKFMNWRHVTFRQPLPISSAGQAAFAANGSRVFLPVGDKNVVAVVKVI